MMRNAWFVRHCLIGTVIIFSVACSDSDNTDNPNVDPFSVPDPSAATVVARLSYPVARDRIDELLSNDFLNLYFDIDDELVTGNLHSSTEPATLDCPGGGEVSCVSNGCIYPLSELSYDNCVIDGKTLSGNVERRGTSFPFASGGSMTIEESFDNFTITAGPSDEFSFSGSVKRTVVDSQFDTGLTREITKTHVVEVLIGASVLKADNSISELNGNYMENTIDKTIVNVDESLTRSSEFSFEGEATISSDLFGAAEVNASKAGTIVSGSNDTSSSPAMLSADFGDTSSFVVTSTSDTDERVQVDIVSGDVSVSYSDDYLFESRLSSLE